jgi:hypothetical protein
MTREEIITSMCYTWRHDYGLIKNEDPGGYTFPGASGMTVKDREHLWNQMAQIFDNDIAPKMIFRFFLEKPAVINPLDVPMVDPKDVRIGRLEKKIRKLINQRGDLRSKNIFLNKMLQYYPHAKLSFEESLKRIDDQQELKVLRARVEMLEGILQKKLKDT